MKTPKPTQPATACSQGPDAIALLVYALMASYHRSQYVRLSGFYPSPAELTALVYHRDQWQAHEAARIEMLASGVQPCAA